MPARLTYVNFEVVDNYQNSVLPLYTEENQLWCPLAQTTTQIII
jgi:hypothetical protein